MYCLYLNVNFKKHNVVHQSTFLLSIIILSRIKWTILVHVSTQIHANKKSTCRRRWKTSQSPLYSHLKTQHVVACCERLHTSANIAQQETTLLGPTMLRVVASVCTGLKKLNCININMYSCRMSSHSTDIYYKVLFFFLFFVFPIHFLLPSSLVNSRVDFHIPH